MTVYTHQTYTHIPTWSLSMNIPAEAFLPPYPYSNVYLENLKIKIGDKTFAIDLNDSPSAKYLPVVGQEHQFALNLLEREYPLTYQYIDEAGDVTLTVAISIGATGTVNTSTGVATDPEFTLGYYVLSFLPGWSGTPERAEAIHDAVIAAVDAVEVVSNSISVKPTPVTLPL